MACDLNVLAQQGIDEGFGGLTKNQFIAAKCFLMADTIFDLTGGAVNYRDLTALTTAMEQFHGMTDYDRNAARLIAWGQIHKITVGEDPDWDQVRRDAIVNAQCLPGGWPCLENSFTFLLCTLVDLILNPP